MLKGSRLPDARAGAVPSTALRISCARSLSWSATRRIRSRRRSRILIFSATLASPFFRSPRSCLTIQQRSTRSLTTRPAAAFWVFRVRAVRSRSGVKSPRNSLLMSSAGELVRSFLSALYRFLWGFVARCRAACSWVIVTSLCVFIIRSLRHFSVRVNLIVSSLS